jgi:hypothetical protein
MEVAVIRAEGAVTDPDSLLSVRVASSRRLAPVELNKPLQFACPAAEAIPFKVDALRKIGAAHHKIGPEDAVYSVPISTVHGQADDASPMRVTLKVKSNFHLCGRSRQEPRNGTSANVSRELPQKPDEAMVGIQDKQMQNSPIFQSTVAEARQYFDDHNVMRCIQALLEALIREQPSEPLEFISIFMERLSRQLRSEQAAEIQKEAEPKGVGSRSDAVARQGHPRQWTEAFDSLDVGSTGKLEECITGTFGETDLIRQKLQDLLLDALKDGSLRNALQDTNMVATSVVAADRNPDLVSATREQMRTSLVGSLEDGRLEAALSENAREKAPDKLAEDGSGFQVIFSNKAEGVGRGTQETMDVLLGALEEETCEASLQLPLPQPLVAEEPQEKSKDLPMGVQHLRESAYNLLMQASQDGSLMAKFSEVREETDQKSQLGATRR